MWLFCFVCSLDSRTPCGVGGFLPHAGTIETEDHQFITAKWEWFVKWKGKWHAWNYSRERDQMNNLLAEWMPVVYWGAKSKLAIWIAFVDGQVLHVFKVHIALSICHSIKLPQAEGPQCKEYPFPCPVASSELAILWIAAVPARPVPFLENLGSVWEPWIPAVPVCTV